MGGKVFNLVYWCAGYEGSEKKNNDEKMREKKISRPGRRGMEEVLSFEGVERKSRSEGLIRFTLLPYGDCGEWGRGREAERPESFWMREIAIG